METKNKKSKAPVIIIIIVAVIVVAAAVFAGLYFGGAFKNNSHNEPTTTQTTTVEDNTVQVMHGQVETEAQSTEANEETTVIVLPTEASGDVSYFSGSYTPNGTVIDTFTGQSSTLKEVFGNGYNTAGKLTFNEDGTFSDTVPSIQAKNGAYVVQNGKIIATYSDDRNMDISVIEWNGNIPAKFYVVYAGYNVYFG